MSDPARPSVMDLVPNRRVLRTPLRRVSRPGLGTHIVAALKEAGRPMDRNELYDFLQSRAVPVPGKDPKANLSAHLSYMHNVQRTEDGLWTLKPEEVPQKKTNAR